MQSSLPTLSLQRFYLSRALQTPRQALREQESTLPSRQWKRRLRQRQQGLRGARPHSPVSGLHLRQPEALGRPGGSGDRAPPRCTRPLPGRDHRSPTCRGLPAATPLAAGRARPQPRRTSPRAAQVGAELHAPPASCMTQAGRRRAAGSAHSLHHPERGRRLTGHVMCGSRVCRAFGKALLRRLGAPGRRGGGGPSGRQGGDGQR